MRGKSSDLFLWVSVAIVVVILVILFPKTVGMIWGLPIVYLISQNQASKNARKNMPKKLKNYGMLGGIIITITMFVLALFLKYELITITKTTGILLFLFSPLLVAILVAIAYYCSSRKSFKKSSSFRGSAIKLASFGILLGIAGIVAGELICNHD